MIRLAVHEDIPNIVGLLKECNLFNSMLDYSTFSHLTLVAEEGGQLRGMIQMLMGKPHAYLSEIAVAPEWQGKGIGSDLLEAAELILKLGGVKAWGGCVSEANINAMKKAAHVSQHRGIGHIYMRIM